MMFVVKLTICLLTILVFISCVQSRVSGPKHGKVVVCHIAPIELLTLQSFKIDDVDLSLCTHLVFDNAYFTDKDFTVHFESGGTLISRKSTDRIKSQYPHIKITSSAVVTSQDDKPIPRNIPTGQKERDKFITNALNHVRDLGLDGLDIFIFSLPETRDDIEDLLNIMQEINDVFQSYNYTLTATLPLFETLLNITDDLVEMNRYVDLLHISTTNFFKVEYKNNHAFVPLKSKNETVWYGQITNNNSVEFMIKHLLEKGFDPSKMVLMSVLYGMAHLLGDRDIEKIPFEDIIATNSFREILPYKEICEELKNGEKSWIARWYEGFSVPYVRDSEYTILYENPRSIVNKVKMAMDYNLIGVAFRGLHIDDYEGKCDIPNDTYIEFTENYNKLINDDPNLLQRLKDLNLPEADSKGNLARGVSYGIFNNKLYFEAPKLRTGPYSIFRAANQAITLSLEEKRILDALKTNKKEPVRKFCLFWPKCATSILTPDPETSS